MWADWSNLYVWIVLGVTLAYGAIGFYDDYLKVTKQHASGFGGKARLGLELIVAAAAAWGIMQLSAPALAGQLAVPFFKDMLIDLGPLFLLAGMLVIAGAGNAVNLTDGLDGLAIVPVMIAAATFGLIAYLVGSEKFATYLQIHYVAGTGELAVICGALIGAGLGFLWFNAPPAMIFMGDTGSLALGGALGAIAVATKHEIVLAIVGGLFVLETLSVDHPGRVIQDDRQARVPHGAAPPSLRAEGLAGEHRGRALLDHFRHPGARRSGNAEAAVRPPTVDARPDDPDHHFAGLDVAVFGLGARVMPPRSRCRGRRARCRLGRQRGGARRRGQRPAFRSSISSAADWARFAALVLAPGVPLTHPEPHWTVKKAEAAGVDDHRRHRIVLPRTREHCPHAPFIAITGTNGKSTTTALIAHILSASRPRRAMGGNIGRAILTLDPPTIGRVYVVECSSFQIDLAPTIRPSVGVLLQRHAGSPRPPRHDCRTTPVSRSA